MELSREEIFEYIEENIPYFHQRRLESLGKLQLKKILKRKNPYLYKAKNIETDFELVRSLLDAHLSSQEEGIFGEFLEGLAIHINSRIFGGHKSSAAGIDFEFEKDSIVYLVSIKSGPNWGNSRQIQKMRDDFRRATRIRRTSSSAETHIVAVNGCCYGRNATEDKGDYLKKCGQSFWEFISGDTDLYVDIVEPLGHQAKQRNEEFAVQYAAVINRFNKEFMEEFCSPDGSVILWNKLVEFNSGKGE